MNRKTESKEPPPVIRRDPELSLEKELNQHPTDPGAKVDLGSDESMDASDPIAAAQPGSTDEPVPSSSFPDEAKNSS